jgi:hypothetical protein
MYLFILEGLEGNKEILAYLILGIKVIDNVLTHLNFNKMFLSHTIFAWCHFLLNNPRCKTV